MKLLLLSVSVLCVFDGGKAAENCKIDGVKWPVFVYIMPQKINDTHEGPIGTFKTENITAIKIRENFQKDRNFLNATLDNDVLTIYTNEHFKNFEKVMKKFRESSAYASIEIECYCVDNEMHSLNIRQEVVDINNHAPVFNQESYEFHFAMGVPEKFDITTFQSIKASDDDFSNTEITFTYDPLIDDILRATFDYDTAYFYAKLILKENIPSSFRREFFIIATDSGEPTLSTKASVVFDVTIFNGTADNAVDHPPVFSKNLYRGNLTNDRLTLHENIVIVYGDVDNITVTQKGYEDYIKISQTPSNKSVLQVEQTSEIPKDIRQKKYITVEIFAGVENSTYRAHSSLLIEFNETGEENAFHPPVFSKNIYYANYTESRFNMNENITIKYGHSNVTTVRQNAYEDFIKIALKENKSTLEVELVKPPTTQMIEKGFVVIEIAAENEGLTIPGRCNLIVNFSQRYDSCKGSDVWISSFNGVFFSLTILIFFMIIIIFCSIIVISYCIRRKNNQITVRQ